MTTPTTAESHRKTASCFVRGVEVSSWCFTRYEPLTEPDGTETLRPRSRDATLIKLPGNRTLWLNVSEHIRLLEALQAVTRELKTGEASPAPSGEMAPTLHDRLWVHRVIEWARGHGLQGELWEGNVETVLTAMGWPVQVTPQRRALLLVESGCLPTEDKYIYEDWDEDNRPVDPYGELEGGRYPISRLLGRRIDRGGGRSGPPNKN